MRSFEYSVKVLYATCYYYYRNSANDLFQNSLMEVPLGSLLVFPRILLKFT